MLLEKRHENGNSFDIPFSEGVSSLLIQELVH
jgi:hypothetical protein